MQINTNYVQISTKMDEKLTLGSCELGAQLWREFGNAKNHRMNAGIDKRLRDAFYSSIGEYTPEALCVIRSNGEDVTVHSNIFTYLRSIFLSWHFDRVDGAGVNLFTVDPTPIPDVPEEMKKTGINQAIQNIFAGNVPPEMLAIAAEKQVKDIKLAMMGWMYRESKKATDGAKTLIMDMMIESDFLREYREWWFDFATYPYAVLQFPYIESKQVLEWKNGKLRPVSKEIVGVKRISPFDFWGSPDSTDGTNGKSSFVRSSLSYDSLVEMKLKSKGAVEFNLDRIINKGMYEPSHTGNGDRPNSVSLNEDEQEKNTDGTYEVIKCWSKFTGAMLKKYGLNEVYMPEKTQVENEKRYELEVWVVNSRVIYIAPNYHPTGKRPFYVASYEPVNGSIYGRGLYDKVSSFERNANNSFRLALKNKEVASGFIAEIDSMRFSTGSPPTADAIRPFSVFQVDGYDAGSNQQAIKFHQIPSQMSWLYQDWDRMKAEAEANSGIYAFMSGATSNVSSALRTKGAVGAVQGNSTKRINFIEQNADAGALCELFTDWWTWCMIHSDDASIKIDASVSVRGLVGVMAEQENKQQAGALMAQYLPAMISAVAQTKGTSLEKFALGAVKDAAEMLGGRSQYLIDPDEVQAVQDLTGVSGGIGGAGNAGGQGQVQQDLSGMTMDGRSAVPPSSDELNRLPTG
jgi:hypothetical protein